MYYLKNTTTKRDDHWKFLDKIKKDLMYFTSLVLYKTIDRSTRPIDQFH